MRLAMRFEVFVSFELAKKLKELGFDDVCTMLYTEYQSDFVYDGDPDHSESHKKGEVRIYDFWNKNSENEKHSYSMPHVYEVQRWFRNRGLSVEPFLDNTCPENRINGQEIWRYKIKDIKRNTEVSSRKYNCFEDAIADGLVTACRLYTSHSHI